MCFLNNSSTIEQLNSEDPEANRDRQRNAISQKALIRSLREESHSESSLSVFSEPRRVFKRGSGAGETPARQQALQILSGLTQVASSNNSVIAMLAYRNTALEGAISSIKQELTTLRDSLGKPSTKNGPSSFGLQEGNAADALIGKLFSREVEYCYRLEVATPLEQPLYKERNFNLEVRLLDAEGQPVLNSNPVPLKLRVYTDDEKPKLLETNQAQQPILKGNSSLELYHGACVFPKLHLREVSSYYPSGVVHLVVCPEAPPFTYSAKESSMELQIDYKLIKPLVCSVTVRAKKKVQGSQ